MPLISFDFQIADFLACFKQIVNDLPRALRWKPPVCAERDDQKPTGGLLEGCAEIPAEIHGRVKIIERLRHQQIGIGIEIFGKSFPLIVQITFYLKVYIESKAQLATAQVSAKV